MKKLVSMILLVGLLAACSGGDDGVKEEPVAEAADVIPEVVVQAIADLSENLEVPETDISLMDFKAVSWSDTSLGCPEEIRVYSPVMKDGYRIRLKSGDATYHYHAGSDMKFSLCDQENRQEPAEIKEGEPSGEAMKKAAPSDMKMKESETASKKGYGK